MSTTTTTTTTTTTASDNIAVAGLLRLGNRAPNPQTDTPLPQQENGPMYLDDNINPIHQLPFSPNHIREKYIGFLNEAGKKHTKCGMYLFQVEQNSTENSTENSTDPYWWLYIGGFQDGNPHGKGILYQQLAPAHVPVLHKMHTMDEVFRFKDQSSVYKDYTCSYEGPWSARNPFVLKGKGEYRDNNKRIVGTFVTEVLDKVQNKFKFEGKVEVTYASGDKFVGYLYPHDVFYAQRGFYTYQDGHTYRGTFPNKLFNQLNHKGTYVDADGHTYTGDFRDDEKHGQGWLTFENGDIFKGQFENDQPVRGTLEKGTSSIRKVRYQGSVNETFEPHGNGQRKTFVNGKFASKYEGEFVRGKPHGRGTETVVNEQFYPNLPGTYISEGVFNKGLLREGEQKFIHATNRRVNFKKQGKFVNGEIRKGIYYHANGDEYHGQFDANGQASGKGTLFQEHATFTGEWKDNKMNGAFDYMKRFSVMNPGEEPKRYHYVRCVNAKFEDNMCTHVQRGGYSDRKRKADFKEFTRVCRQRVGSSNGARVRFNNDNNTDDDNMSVASSMVVNAPTSPRGI
ncbi:MAG: hypothetical protein CMF52_00525 [Legionellales bacterium]|nr:hypothetical protein [Legionellales bacterium]